MNAQATQSVSYTVTTGMEKTSTTSWSVAISAEAGATIKGIFELKTTVTTEFGGVESSTWKEEKSRTDTITVNKGDSVAVWQWVMHGTYA